MREWGGRGKIGSMCVSCVLHVCLSCVWNKLFNHTIYGPTNDQRTVMLLHILMSIVTTVVYSVLCTCTKAAVDSG